MDNSVRENFLDQIKKKIDKVQSSSESQKDISKFIYGKMFDYMDKAKSEIESNFENQNSASKNYDIFNSVIPKDELQYSKLFEIEIDSKPTKCTENCKYELVYLEKSLTELNDFDNQEIKIKMNNGNEDIISPQKLIRSNFYKKFEKDITTLLQYNNVAFKYPFVPHLKRFFYLELPSDVKEFEFMGNEKTFIKRNLIPVSNINIKELDSKSSESIIIDDNASARPYNKELNYKLTFPEMPNTLLKIDSNIEFEFVHNHELYIKSNDRNNKWKFITFNHFENEENEFEQFDNSTFKENKILDNNQRIRTFAEMNKVIQSYKIIKKFNIKLKDFEVSNTEDTKDPKFNIKAELFTEDEFRDYKKPFLYIQFSSETSDCDSTELDKYNLFLNDVVLFALNIIQYNFPEFSCYGEAL